MSLYVTVKLRIDDGEVDRVQAVLDESEFPREAAHAIAEGILARVFPVAGCDPAEFTAADASVQVEKERVRVSAAQ